MKVYVVKEASGSYSDYTENITHVCLMEERAKEYKTEFYVRLFEEWKRGLQASLEYHNNLHESGKIFLKTSRDKQYDEQYHADLQAGLNTTSEKFEKEEIPRTLSTLDQSCWIETWEVEP